MAETALNIFKKLVDAAVASDEAEDKLPELHKLLNVYGAKGNGYEDMKKYLFAAIEKIHEDKFVVACNQVMLGESVDDAIKDMVASNRKSVFGNQAQSSSVPKYPSEEMVKRWVYEQERRQNQENKYRNAMFGTGLGNLK